MNANEIAASRPPDRVTFGEWEPVHSAVERVRQVATEVRGLFFRHVEEYTEVRDHPVIGYRRERREFWYEPRRPIYEQVGPNDYEYGIREEPAQTVGRMEWEHRSVREMERAWIEGAPE